jgi:two-component system, chemotaxis family, chemotaxis protein CheY
MKTILIADDSSFIRNKIKQIIEQNYLILAEAKDGEEAINYFMTYQPDIVLLDLTMPNVDGLKALKEIMKMNPNAKVIVFSAWATKYTMIEAIQSGAKDFIIKPHFNQLIPSLRKL